MVGTTATSRVPGELFFATWGRWDEGRHLRHCAECWERGGIFCIQVDGVRVGMIQLFDQPDAIEVGEIQIQPSHQGRGIGTRLMTTLLVGPTRGVRRCPFLPD